MNYSPVFEAQVRDWAIERIKPKRLPHVQGVVETVDWLAARYAPDQVLRARLAGWIHDVAKHLPDEELLRIAEARQWPISDTERNVPDLLHGVVGYFLAGKAFGLDDPMLQTACAYHTTGAPDMNTLDKIVMLGDLIEPSRTFDGVEALREIAHQDLDSAVLMSLDYTISYLIRRQRIIDPRPVFLRNQLIGAGVHYPSE